MKKFSKIIYFLMLAVLIFSLSGCEKRKSLSDSGSNGSNNTNEESTYEFSVTKIVLDSTNETATISTGTRSLSKDVNFDTAAEGTLEAENYVWHISPDQGEYWTDPDGNIITDEDDVINALASDEGIYIARDIRYVPDTLEFSSTAVNKEQGGQDTCYVSYYSTNMDGVDTANTYILAALPTEYNGQQNVGLSTVKAAMTHSASDAYNNPVLHITKAGIYALSGTWNGQIWVDIPDESTTSGTETEDDPNAQVILILESLDVKCTVAPALVFKNVFQCSGDIDEESEVSALITSDNYSMGTKLADSDNYYAGAVVLLAAGKTNTFTGTNVPRLNKLKINEDDGYTESNVGQYVKAQKKLYKLDAAFHSRQSIVIANETIGTDGTLTINSDYEGLGSELHMLIDSGAVKVTANDDGININEDNVSVFTMTGGTLTITSNYGDGIDSNGWVALKDCTLNITAGNQKIHSEGEAGIDAEKEVYGVDSSGNATNGSNVTYNYNPNNNSNGGGNPPSGDGSDGTNGTEGGTPPTENNGGDGGTPPSGTPGGVNKN